MSMVKVGFLPLQNLWSRVPFFQSQQYLCANDEFIFKRISFSFKINLLISIEEFKVDVFVS